MMEGPYRPFAIPAYREQRDRGREEQQEHEAYPGPGHADAQDDARPDQVIPDRGAPESCHEPEGKGDDHGEGGREANEQEGGWDLLGDKAGDRLAEDIRGAEI